MNSVQPAPAAQGSNTARADLVAAALSMLCLLHCLALPLLVPLLPLAGQLFGGEQIHRLLVLLAAPFSLGVMVAALRVPPRSHAAGLAVALLTGLGLLLLALTEPLAAYERPLTVTGAVLLAATHLWHWRRIRLP
ncbi:MAG: MerC family mercury resistance protein [Pseudomonadota bacterium]